MTRSALLDNFLNRNDLSKASRQSLAGDASARRYIRLTHLGQSYVLMDDPTGTPQAVGAFVSIATHLQSIGLSAPRVISQDIPNGFLLLEDLGDALFSRELKRQPSLESSLYLAATELLLPLQSATMPLNLPVYDATAMARATDLAFLWYQQTPQNQLSAEASQAICYLNDALQALSWEPALALRDYHAENLIWRPDRSRHARVGLLDFQDAVATHPIYDVVSLIRDARRDVSAEVAASCLSRFAETHRISHDEAGFSAALIATQRNLRILGIFARLSRHLNKPGYINLIPRVWRMFTEDLNHPELRDLKQQLTPLLPAPTHELLNTLRTPCPTPS